VDSKTAILPSPLMPPAKLSDPELVNCPMTESTCAEAVDKFTNKNKNEKKAKKRNFTKSSEDF
jgi:hypothetical protein